MRKESSNQFTEGMVCDLNPINTPNTVLTDALNATVITYDGNEYSLQNDMGNYQLRNCRLKPNYIPVGLKEYGDILYVVSYNPLDKHVEIGSYPSPRNVESSSEDGGEGLEVTSIIGSFTGTIDYSELIKRGKLLIYTGNNEQRFKMYPGDKYRIRKDKSSEFKYETLDYFIIDENRKKYNISDLIVLDGEFHNIPWQVPGWLAAQYRLGNFEDFIMSIRSFTVPAIADDGDIDCNANLHFQFKISDELFLPITKGTQEETLISENNIKSDLFIKLLIKVNSRIIKEDISLLTDGQFVEWYKDSKILWTNFKTTLSNLNKKDNIIIEATPYLKIITDDVERIINYDHLKEYFSFTINTIGSASDFRIGEKLWKFYAEPNGNLDNVCYIEFDVNGPAVTSNQVDLFYRLLDIKTKETIVAWQRVNGYTGISDQIVSWIGFDERFKRESMYIIDFAFASDIKCINENYITKKLLITSSVFGELTGKYSNFEEIYFDEWAIKGYENSLQINKILTTSTFSASNEFAMADHYWDQKDRFLKKEGSRVFEDDVLNDIWSQNKKDNKGWIQTSSLSKYKDIVTNVIFSKKYNANVKAELNEVSILKGELWNDSSDVNISLVDLNENKTIDSTSISRNNLSNGKKVEFNVSTKRSKTKKYTTRVASEIFKSLINIEKINDVQTMWLSINPNHINLNDRLTLNLYDTGVINFSDDFETSSWTNSTTLKSSVTLSRTNLTISGTMPKAILTLLGDKQVGILGLKMTSFDYKRGDYQLKHGSNEIHTVERDEPEKLYTYLVIRTNNNASHALMIPISGNVNLWDNTIERTKTGDGSWHSNVLSATTNYASIVKDWCVSFLQNILICTQNNSLNNFKLVKIDQGEESSQNIANYSLNVIIPEKTSWMFKDYDLLKSTHRDVLKNTIGLKNENDFICGNLLTSNISYINEKLVKSYNIKDTGEPELDTAMSDFDREVSLINDMIFEPNVTGYTSVISQMESRSGTKGIYSINSSDKNSSIVKMFDDDYKSGTYKYLTGTSVVKGDLELYIENDENSIILGKVATTLNAS